MWHINLPLFFFGSLSGKVHAKDRAWGGKQACKEREEGMLKKYCKCGALIPATEKQCSKCRSRYHKAYDKYTRDDLGVYSDRRWPVLKAVCKDRAKGIDLWHYYKTGRIVQGRLAHHIIEVSEDMGRAYDPTNLFWLTDKSHQEVHALYKKNLDSKKETQEKLFELNKNFAGGG